MVAPVVDEVYPAELWGGTAAVAFGSALSAVTAVEVDGAPVDVFAAVNDSAVTFLVPERPAGPALLEVVTPAGVSAAVEVLYVDPLAVPAPVVSLVPISPGENFTFSPILGEFLGPGVVPESGASSGPPVSTDPGNGFMWWGWSLDDSELLATAPVESLEVTATMPLTDPPAQIGNNDYLWFFGAYDRITKDVIPVECDDPNVLFYDEYSYGYYPHAPVKGAAGTFAGPLTIRLPAPPPLERVAIWVAAFVPAGPLVGPVAMGPVVVEQGAAPGLLLRAALVRRLLALVRGVLGNSSGVDVGWAGAPRTDFSAGAILAGKILPGEAGPPTMRARPLVLDDRWELEVAALAAAPGTSDPEAAESAATLAERLGSVVAQLVTANPTLEDESGPLGCTPSVTVSRIEGPDLGPLPAGSPGLLSWVIVTLKVHQRLELNP